MYERRNGIIYYVADGKHLPPVAEKKSSPKRGAEKKSKKK